MVPSSHLARALLVVLASGVAVCAPRPVLAQSVGVIQGSVQLEELPARRTVNRYPAGARQGEVHRIQTLPAVAYLVGPVPGGPGGASETHSIMTQHDTTFVPSVVFVRAGGSVSFANDDPFQHNVFAYSKAAEFDLGAQNPGTESVVTFDETGIVEVFCDIHDFMRGAIIITENSYSAIVGADGSFRIAGVPAGEHTIAFWHPGHESVQQTVVVPAGGTATVQVQMRR